MSANPVDAWNERKAIGNILWSILVPNHLSTQKNYQSTPSIPHPYSSLFTTFRPPDLKTTTLHQSGEEKRGVGEKKRVAASGKKMKRGVAEGLRGRKKGGLHPQSLIIYRPSLSPPMPNHLSTRKKHLHLATNP